MTVSEEQHPGPEGHQPPEQLAGETKLVLPWSPPETGLTPASGRDAMGRLTGLEVVPPGQGPWSSHCLCSVRRDQGGLHCPQQACNACSLYRLIIRAPALGLSPAISKGEEGFLPQ